MGGVLRYKLEVCCGVSLSPKFRSQQGTALQMGGVLLYKLEVYCQYFSDKLYGLGVPEQFPNYFVYFVCLQMVLSVNANYTQEVSGN